MNQNTLTHRRRSTFVGGRFGLYPYPFPAEPCGKDIAANPRPVKNQMENNDRNQSYSQPEVKIAPVVSSPAQEGFDRAFL